MLQYHSFSSENKTNFFLIYLPIIVTQILACLTLLISIVLYIIYYNYINQYLEGLFSMNDVQVGTILGLLIFWKMVDWLGLIILIEHSLMVKLYC